MEKVTHILKEMFPKAELDLACFITINVDEEVQTC